MFGFLLEKEETDSKGAGAQKVCSRSIFGQDGAWPSTEVSATAGPDKRGPPPRERDLDALVRFLESAVPLNGVICEHL